MFILPSYDNVISIGQNINIIALLKLLSIPVIATVQSFKIHLFGILIDVLVSLIMYPNPLFRDATPDRQTSLKEASE